MNNKTLYLECSGGISGDMFVAAMLDLGADEERLKKVLASVPLDGFRTEIKRVKSSGIAATDFDVILDEDNHDHDMHYLYGHEASAGGHTHGNGGGPHGHAHGGEPHDHHHHGHTHRGLKEIHPIIDGTDMPAEAKALAKKIFAIIADAESKAHGVPAEEVHFHEVGAVDSIVDIIAAAFTFTDLGFDEVIVPALTEGGGTVRTQHGILPVPVPAVLHIAQDHALPLRLLDVKGEYVTPTGAAIAAAVRTGKKLPEELVIKRTGYGAGKRQQALSGLLRAMEIEG